MNTIWINLVIIDSEVLFQVGNMESTPLRLLTRTTMLIISMTLTKALATTTTTWVIISLQNNCSSTKSWWSRNCGYPSLWSKRTGCTLTTKTFRRILMKARSRSFLVFPWVSWVTSILRTSYKAIRRVSVLPSRSLSRHQLSTWNNLKLLLWTLLQSLCITKTVITSLHRTTRAYYCSQTAKWWWTSKPHLHRAC